MKKKKSSGGGGANWMDTYGDMVTLLLCFFVLLYSMSTISEDKWKALVLSFNPDAQQTQTEIEGNDGPSADPENQGGDTVSPNVEDQTEIDTMIESLYQQLQEYSEQEGMQDTLSVTKDGGKIYVKFNETAFFNGDSAVLREDAKAVLGHVCNVLNGVADAVEEIRIQGHTAQADPNRINNYRADRTLASERATEVVIFLQDNSKLHPARLVSEGYGQWRPVASNQTTESRAENRRVEMIISGRDLKLEGMGESVESFITEENANPNDE